MSNALSQKEAEVHNYVIAGLTNAEIARNMGIKEKSVKFHLTAVYKKLGVKGRVELLSRYIKPAIKRYLPEVETVKVPQTSEPKVTQVNNNLFTGVGNGQ